MHTNQFYKNIACAFISVQILSSSSKYIQHCTLRKLETRETQAKPEHPYCTYPVLHDGFLEGQEAGCCIMSSSSWTTLTQAHQCSSVMAQAFMKRKFCSRQAGSITYHSSFMVVHTLFFLYLCFPWMQFMKASMNWGEGRESVLEEHMLEKEKKHITVDMECVGRLEMESTYKSIFLNSQHSIFKS